jgi:hypothetical protein
MLNNGSAKRKSNIGDLEARKITAEDRPHSATVAPGVNSS